ncbi:hypothetical protein [Burkholderia sp. PU8-34]
MRELNFAETTRTSGGGLVIGGAISGNVGSSSSQNGVGLSIAYGQSNPSGNGGNAVGVSLNGGALNTGNWWFFKRK